jgi:hypothetical protein
MPLSLTAANNIDGSLLTQFLLEMVEGHCTCFISVVDFLRALKTAADMSDFDAKEPMIKKPLLHVTLSAK